MQARHLRVLGIFLLLSGVLINYQNCGQSHGAAGPAAKAANDGGSVDIIDQNITGGLSFVDSKVTLSASDQNLKASGLCSADQDGALISWKVYDGEDVVAEGKALCDKSLFNVEISDANDVACGANLHLEAALGAKAKAELAISKNCN